jgi:bacterioferritin-associated ferredoxin
MYVCLCNGFTDNQIRVLTESGDCHSAAGVHRALGGRVRCGKCLPMMVEMVRGAKEAPAMASLPAASGVV